MKAPEYLIRLPSNITQWVTYTPAMLDPTDPDDRQVDAAMRHAGLPAGSCPVRWAGKLVRR